MPTPVAVQAEQAAEEMPALEKEEITEKPAKPARKPRAKKPADAGAEKPAPKTRAKKAADAGAEKPARKPLAKKAEKPAE